MPWIQNTINFQKRLELVCSTSSIRGMTLGNCTAEWHCSYGKSNDLPAATAKKCRAVTEAIRCTRVQKSAIDYTLQTLL